MTRAKAEEYRRRARECLDLARKISLERVRAVILNMAQSWLRRAQAEEAQGEIIEPPLTEQPQQQQQTHPKDEDKKE